MAMATKAPPSLNSILILVVAVVGFSAVKGAQITAGNSRTAVRSYSTLSEAPALRSEPLSSKKSPTVRSPVDASRYRSPGHLGIPPSDRLTFPD